MPSMPQELDGLTVLIVEDNYLVAEAVREIFEERGSTVIGPAARVEEALRLAETELLDGAVLDINLAGEFCFPVAAALHARQVPFLFITGYGEAMLIPAQFRDVPRLPKPFDALEVAEIAAQLFAGRQAMSSNGAGPPSRSS
ncbi:MAG: response regulator [Alphaproteobacteria bacterium]|nr:response regulator [Alphaproteobacteria bacterium]